MMLICSTVVGVGLCVGVGSSGLFVGVGDVEVDGEGDREGDMVKIGVGASHELGWVPAMKYSL